MWGHLLMMEGKVQRAHGRASEDKGERGIEKRGAVPMTTGD